MSGKLVDNCSQDKYENSYVHNEVAANPYVANK